MKIRNEAWRRWRIIGPLLAVAMLTAVSGRPAAAKALPAENNAAATLVTAPEPAARQQVAVALNRGLAGLRLAPHNLGVSLISLAARASISSTATTTPACPPDAQEPNDSPATVRTVPVAGVIRDLTLCPAGDVDYFALQTLPSQHYAVETVVEAGLDTLLAVSQNGQTVGQNNDKSPSDHGSRVEFDALYGGDFTLAVSDVSASGASGLHYTLLVTANPLPTGTPWPTGTPTQSGTPTQTPTLTPIPSPSATPVPCLDAYEDDGLAATAKAILPGETQARLLCPAGDADWLTFFANPGKGYKVATSALGSGVDTYLYLFAPDGATVLASNDDAPGQPGPAQLIFYPAVDGWYFMQVKNQGDIGFPGLGYKVNLSIVDAASSTPAPTNTAAPTITPAPSNTPTATASAPPTNTPTSAGMTPVNTPAPVSVSQVTLPPAANTPVVVVITATPAASTASTADDLLRPQDGGAASGGVPVFDAGPPDAMQPDKLEPDDTFSAAGAINVGAVYQQLNFVPVEGAEADGDFYSFRAKPGLCYAVQTGDLSAGLDTTILLWQAGVTREARKLVAQNDDAHPKTADLSSSVRWCSPSDGFMVIELHNYGWAPQTDPRGKSYSLAVLIDPPTPTPTRTTRSTDTGAAAAAGGATMGGSGAGGATGGNTSGAAAAVAVAPTWTPSPTATATPTPSSTAAPATVTADLDGVVTTTPGGHTQTPTLTATATATATPLPTGVADLTCYLDLNQNEAPDPGEGIAGLRGVVIDTTSNAIIVEARSDANGHIRLAWQGRASVRIALPDLGWNQEVLATQLQRAKDEPLGGGHWSADVRVKAPALPGILP